MDDTWLTYQQAGQRLGISAEAARQRALRGHWPKRRSNDGTTVIRVPEGVAVRMRPPVEHPDEHPDASVCVRMAELQAQVTLLREMLKDMRDDRDRWRGMAERLAERRPAATAAADIIDRMRAARQAS